MRLLLRQCATVAQDGEKAAGGRGADATGAERVAQRQGAQGRHDEGSGEHWIGAREEGHFSDVLMFFSLSFFPLTHFHQEKTRNLTPTKATAKKPV